MLISGGNFSYEETIEPPGLSQYVVVPNDTLSTALVDVDFDIFNA